MRVLSLIGLMLLISASSCAKIQSEDSTSMTPVGSVSPSGTGGRNAGAIVASPRGESDGGGIAVEAGPRASCGTFMFTPVAKTAILMLVLDRSGSMKNSLPGNGGTKWTVVTEAVAPAISATQSAIEWGLKTFPGDSGCGVAADIDVSIAPMNYARMSTTIQATSPNGDGTPTGDGVLAAANYLRGLSSSTDPKYILLATDGDPSCPGDGITYALQQITDARASGINTFVMGVGTGSSSGTHLDAMAVAGGAARPVTNPLDSKYFPANSPTELADTLKAITGQIASCTFSLGRSPPDSQFVNVTLGAAEIPFDVAGREGWNFNAGDTTTVTVVGTWCDQIQSSPDSVGIVFGCKPPIIP